MGGLSGEEWSTFKRRGREILRRARDQKGCLRRLREKADAFLRLDPVAAKSKGDWGWYFSSGAGAEISAPDMARLSQIQVSNEQSEGAVSSKINPNFSSVGLGDSGGLNSGVNGVDLRAKFGEEREYLSAGIQREFHKDWAPSVPSVSVLCSLCLKQDLMATRREAEMDLDAGAVGTGAGSGAPAAALAGVEVATGAAVSSPTPTGREVRERSNSPMLDKGIAKVGGPTGLALTATPKATVGFTAAAAPPQLCRNRKSKEASSSRAFSKPIVINLEAPMRAVAGKLAVARVLSPYPVDPKMVVNELRGPWRLRGDAVA